MKRFVSLFLLLCMLCSALPAVAEEYTIRIGNFTMTAPDGTDLPTLYDEPGAYALQTGSTINNGILFNTNMFITTVKYDLTDGWREEVESSSNVAVQNLFYCNTMLNDLYFKALTGWNLIENYQFYTSFESTVVTDLTPDGAETWIGMCDIGYSNFCIACGHYYEGNGLYILMYGDNSNSRDDMLDIIYQMMSSLELVDGETTPAASQTIMNDVVEDIVDEPQQEQPTESDTVETAEEAVKQYVVITASSANLRAGAGMDTAKLGTALQGETYQLLGEEGNWYEIDFNGQTAYVSKGLSELQ